MDRKPNPPPFLMGARVRYNDAGSYRGGKPLLVPDDIGVVTKVVPGRQGTLAELDAGDGITDGRSVITFPNGFTRLMEQPADRYEVVS